MQTASWMDARARLNFKGTPRILTVDSDGHRRATAVLCQTKFGLREMPLMNEPSDFAWTDEAALSDLVDLLIGQRKAFFLERVPAKSPTVPALVRASRGKVWLRVEPAPPTPYLDTKGKTINDLVKSGRRSDLRRAEKRLAKLGHVTYELRAPGSQQDLDTLIEEAFDVETRSWKHDTGTCLTSPAEATYAAAFRGFLEDAHREGHIRFAFVRLDGKAIAMQIASEWQNRYWIYKATFDKEHSKSSPGNLLYFHTLDQTTQKGLLSYEFMGKMDSWTSAWTQDARDYVRIYGLPHNARGLVGAAALGHWTLKRRFDERKAARSDTA
jgi:CelD/BcsL family acetyltransferase involved in cellulose biosynthesis